MRRESTAISTPDSTQPPTIPRYRLNDGYASGTGPGRKSGQYQVEHLIEVHLIENVFDSTQTKQNIEKLTDGWYRYAGQATGGHR